jgi:putative transposase
MIDRTHDLPITRQAVALGISRGAVYYVLRPMSAFDLAWMRRMDLLHLDFPFAGARMLRRLLRPDFAGVGRRRTRVAVASAGVEVTPRPCLSLPLFCLRPRGRRLLLTTVCYSAPEQRQSPS